MGIFAGGNSISSLKQKSWKNIQNFKDDIVRSVEIHFRKVDQQL